MSKISSLIALSLGWWIGCPMVTTGAAEEVAMALESATIDSTAKAVDASAKATGEMAKTDEPEAEPDEPAVMRRQGKWVWADLLTSGVPAELAPFYANVLGWTPETIGEGAYAYVRFSLGGRPVAGIAHRPDSQPGTRRARWVGFLSVVDLAAELRRTTDSGGRVLVPAASWPGRGEQAVIADVEGATVGLLAAGDGDDAGDYAAVEGEWIWPMLFTRRLEAALEFYGKALGYRIELEQRTPLFQGDFILARGVRARAGVMVLPLRSGGRPGWLGLIRVADLEETLEKVREHDGQVLHGPTPDLIGGRVAVIADPQGGVVGFVQTTLPAAAKPAADDAIPGEAVAIMDAAVPADGVPATTEGGEAGKLEYGWRDPGFYEPWFDPAAIVLPPPTAFRGFGTDGRLIPLLPNQPRP